jgi:hypothetical protein
VNPVFPSQSMSSGQDLGIQESYHQERANQQKNFYLFK